MKIVNLMKGTKVKNKGCLSRRVLSILLAVALVIGVVPTSELTIYADTYESGGYTYSILSEENKTCEITGYSGSDEDLEIPSELAGYSVTSIGEWAFDGCTGLTSIMIPDSVTSMGTAAFQGCSGLISVIIPDSVISIAEWAFASCTSLRYIAIGNGVTSIGDDAFRNVTLSYVIYFGNVYDYANIIKGKGNTAIAKAIKIYKNADNYLNHWGFQNFEAEITLENLEDMFGQNKGSKLYEEYYSDGKGGVCFGMALSSGIIEYSSTFDSNNLFKTNYLSDIATPAETSCSFTSVDTALDIIKYCHLYQFTKENAKTKVSNRNDISGMIDTIEKFERGEAGAKPVVINLGPHAVLAESITENNQGGWDIEVYDSNYINTSNILSIYKEGSTYKWSMLYQELADGEEISGDWFEGTEGDFSYFEVDDSIMNKIVMKEKFDAQNYILKTIVKNLNNTVIISRVSETLLDSEIVYDDDSSDLYWVEEEDNVIEITLSEDDETFGLYGNNTEFTGNISQNAELVFSVETGDINAVNIENLNDVDVTFEGMEGYNIHLSGDDADGTVSISDTEDGFYVSGIDAGTEIIVKDNNDKVIVSQTMPYDSQAVITDLDNGQIKCDINGDGNYTVVEETEEKTTVAACNHSYTKKTTKATLSKNGKIVTKCSICGDISSTTTIAKIKSATLSKTTYVYNGKAKKPSVTVKDSNGKKISSKYYTVTYKNNKKVGKATVTIKFKGNYSGTITKTFTIKPKSTSISKLTAKSKGFTLKWKKVSSQISGYQIQYSTSKKFTSKTTKTVLKSKTSLTVNKLKVKKKYYVRIRTYKTVSGKKYYSSWSKVKTVKTKR